MAAYAALVTLLNLIEDMQNHPRLSTTLDNKQIGSLTEKVHFLLNLIEAYDRIQAEDLMMQIASTAQEVEDVIESHIVDRILAGSPNYGPKSSNFSLNLQKKFRGLGKKLRYLGKNVQEEVQSKDAKSRLKRLIREMDSIMEKMVKIEIKPGFRDESVLTTSSAPPFASRKPTMVGFEEELIQLMDVLTSQKSSRQIISIVAMGGAGKTTLTRNAFENSLIEQHFDILAWATVSQEYSVRDILLQLLSYKKSIAESDDKLGEELYKKLLGKRYLIVLDDMWSIDAWDEMRFFLPDNGHRSRIVVTTRLSNLAAHVSSFSFVMNFLDKDKSWKLFCEKAFGDDDCPPELEEIAKEIVEQCKGLPLSVVVMGGYLSKSSRSKEHWEYIANDINKILCSEKDDHCLRILHLSYCHLPVHLKPCFLYMGIFREDEEIRVWNVIQLWVAEGFLKRNKVQSFEEIGESYLEDLVDRNLILIHRSGHNGKFIYYKIHDLVRDVCLKEAEKEKFLCLLSLIESETPRSIKRERRVAIHGGTLDGEYNSSTLFNSLKSAPLFRSFISSKSCSRSNKQWVEVAEDMISFLNSGEEQCLSILSLSYSHLPIFLKPCFIYMGIFPEDEDILISTLIRLWVAEGFLRSNGDRSPEQITEGYIKDLVERNLISVESKGDQFGEVLTCNTHDLLRELCLKVAKEEKFFCVLKHPAATSRCCTICPMNHNGRYSIDNSRLCRILSQPEDNWDEDELNLQGQFATSQYFSMRYTFGCVSWQQKVSSIPVAGLHPSVWKPHCFNLPSSISLQWNLQTIVLRGTNSKFLAPCEIWEMPQLRHVDISHLILPSPPADDDDDVVVMQNLRTLLVVDNLKLCEEVYRRIPNLQELQIHYNLEESSSSRFDYYYQDHLCCFNKLESLTLNFYETSDWRGFAMYVTLPRSLKELRLESSSLVGRTYRRLVRCHILKCSR